MLRNTISKRLLLSGMKADDSDFILQLVNTPDWVKFIGDRNIKTRQDAQEYIQKLVGNPDITYWVVRLKEVDTAIGVITFIKRDYLNSPDIGFAFLPDYAGKGYASEATQAVLQLVADQTLHAHILAITIGENRRSVRLLERLGFQFQEEMQREEEVLLVYRVATDKLRIDEVVRQFYSVFTNVEKQPDWEKIRSLCLAETILIRKSGVSEEVYDLDSFIEPRRKILSDGTLTAFEEQEVNEVTTVVGNIAQRSSAYQKSGYRNGTFFQEQGHKFFQLVKTEIGWKISSVVWEDGVSIKPEKE